MSPTSYQAAPPRVSGVKPNKSRRNGKWEWAQNARLSESSFHVQIQARPMTASQTAADATAPHLASPETNPSFLKGVFLGELQEDLVFPFPALSPEERESLGMILDSLRAFAAE